MNPVNYQTLQQQVQLLNAHRESVTYKNLISRIMLQSSCLMGLVFYYVPREARYLLLFCDINKSITLILLQKPRVFLATKTFPDISPLIHMKPKYNTNHPLSHMPKITDKYISAYSWPDFATRAKCVVLL